MHNLRRNRQENLAKIEIRTLAQLQEKGPCKLWVGGHAYSVLEVPYMKFLDVHVLD